MINEKNLMFGFTAALGLLAFFLGPNASAATPDSYEYSVEYTTVGAIADAGS